MHLNPDFIDPESIRPLSLGLTGSLDVKRSGKRSTSESPGCWYQIVRSVEGTQMSRRADIRASANSGRVTQRLPQVALDISDINASYGGGSSVRTGTLGPHMIVTRSRAD